MLQQYQMVILVSSLFDNINKRNNIEWYIDCGRAFLQLPHQKLLFTNIKTIQEEDNLKIISQEIHTLTVENFFVNTDYKEKDTIEYMFLINSKVKFIKQAAEIYPENEQFMWLDFGLSHVFENIENFKIPNNTYDKVRIAGIWDFDRANSINNLTTINWFFAGGVFGGHRDILLKFAEYSIEECDNIIKEHKTLMWEVNVWFEIYKKYGDLFSIYQCDHNDSILLNY